MSLIIEKLEKVRCDSKVSPLLCLTFEASDIEVEEKEEADDGHGGGTLN